MENHERGLETPSKEIPQLKGKHRKENRLTVIIMRSVGKVRSFKISSWFIFFSSLFFVAYISFSAYIINDYLELRRMNSDYSSRIEKLETDGSQTIKMLDRSKQHIALLEDYIRNLETPIEEEKVQTAGEGKKEMKKAVRSNTPLEQEKTIEKPLPKIVDIRDMVIQKEGPLMMVNFKLMNLRPGENAVGGYIHVIASSEVSGAHEGWTYPKEKLKNGVPANFRRGLLFLIQRFRPIKAKFNLASSKEPPSAIKIIVYDQSGRIMLEREFEVTNVS